MTDQKPPTSPAVPREPLEALGDDALEALIREARAVLKQRAEQRQRAALREIKAIAKAAGLDVSARRPAKKRGRPKKDT